MSKTIGCIIARTASTRLPKKVLREINGSILIEYIINKLKKAKNIDVIYMCTSDDPLDEILLDIAEKNDIKAYAGSKDAVIERMLYVGKKENADNLIRITGDNVFSDEIFIDKMVELHNSFKVDYTRTGYLPIGVSAEIYSYNGLKDFYHTLDPNQTEYLSYYVLHKENNLKKLILVPPQKFKKPFYSLTVDTPEDLERTQFIIRNIKNPKGLFLDEIFQLNDRTKIPFFEVDESLPVKLPNKTIMSYKEYRYILDEKFQDCIIYNLEEDFYERNKNKRYSRQKKGL